MAPDFRSAAMSGGVKPVYGRAMRHWIFLIYGLLGFVAGLAPAFATTTVAVKNVIQCPALPDDAAPPAFVGPDCKTLPFQAVDPQGRHLWLKTSVEATDALLASGKPIGVFISGKASSEVYLNGHRLGQNGSPASTEENEIPGRMDAVFYAPREIVRSGKNELVIRLSSHHGFVHFRYPMHWLALGEYANPTAAILNAYWPSLIPFGALIAGVLYFFASAVSGGFRLNVLLLALASLFAAGQLYVEVYRGLSSYAYPTHEWRMILVVLFSIGFGLCLIAHVSAKFLDSRWRYVFGATAIATIASTFLAAGYDGKAALGVLTPSVIGAAIAGYASFRRRPQARLYVAVITIFAATILIYPNRFLDVLFFYEVAALLLVLFVAQAFALAKERKQREDEQARSKQLALSLERAEQSKAARHIKVSGTGKIDMAPTHKITHCKGAGDYVEIFLNDGREILHNGSLTQLEQELPATFLRVHRSYLVNTNFVSSLTREASGIGRLLLTTSAEIPVSRRIMPKIRSALN
jgi:DNA-binding LytR/AlgR family response regulator